MDMTTGNISTSRLDVHWSLESNGYLSANEEDGHVTKKSIARLYLSMCSPLLVKIQIIKVKDLQITCFEP